MSYSIEMLLSGYKKFYKNCFLEDKFGYKEFLSSGQYPKALVIACSDSRVDPALITGSELGDIFSVRNVANLVPCYEMDNTTFHGVSSAIEFAVKALMVSDIIILGHSSCSGISKLVDDIISGNRFDSNLFFVSKWIKINEKAISHFVSEKIDKMPIEVLKNECAKLSIELSISNLLTFPFVKSLVESSSIKVHGWYFEIQTGKLHIHDKSLGCFKEYS